MNYDYKHYDDFQQRVAYKYLINNILTLQIKINIEEGAVTQTLIFCAYYIEKHDRYIQRANSSSRPSYLGESGCILIYIQI